MFVFLKKILIIAFLFYFAADISAHSDSTKFTINKVEINGESNVMNFWIKYAEKESGKINYTHIHSGSSNNPERVIKLPIAKFIAQNKHIKSDFEKLIKEEEYPYILLRVYESLLLNDSAELSEDMVFYITIGGVENPIPFYCERIDDNEIAKRFKGTGIINLSEFGLKAPKKMFGLIKIKETIMITFEFEVYSQKN